MVERRKYSKEFKLDAISLVTEQGYAIAEAARSLGINANVLGRWIRNPGRKNLMRFVVKAN